MMNNNENDLQKSSTDTEKSSRFKDLLTQWRVRIVLSVGGALLMFFAVEYMLPVKKVESELDTMKKYEIDRLDREIIGNEARFEKLRDKFNNLENRIIVIETKLEMTKPRTGETKARE